MSTLNLEMASAGSVSPTMRFQWTWCGFAPFIGGLPAVHAAASLALFRRLRSLLRILQIHLLHIRLNSGGGFLASSTRLVNPKSSQSRFGVGSLCSTAQAWSLLPQVSHSSHFQNSQADASNQETAGQQFRREVFVGLSLSLFTGRPGPENSACTKE